MPTILMLSFFTQVGGVKKILFSAPNIPCGVFITSTFLQKRFPQNKGENTLNLCYFFGLIPYDGGEKPMNIAYTALSAGV